MLVSGLHLSDLNKETTYLLTYLQQQQQYMVKLLRCVCPSAFL